jgi:hypothetical protein
MAINKLYDTYFQKSRVFLYPLLGIAKGVSVTPINTYVSWEGMYKPEDMKLICVYHLRDDSEFQLFERKALMGNKLYHDFKMLDGNKGAYVFDLSDYKSEWEAFIMGKYSKMPTEHKRRLRLYFGPKTANYQYVETYLEPEKHFETYSKLIGIPVSTLKEIGELCSLPDFEKENLTEKVKDLHITEELS